MQDCLHKNRCRGRDAIIFVSDFINQTLFFDAGYTIKRKSLSENTSSKQSHVPLKQPFIQGFKPEHEYKNAAAGLKSFKMYAFVSQSCIIKVPLLMYLTSYCM